jgi:hypothetical protein
LQEVWDELYVLLEVILEVDTHGHLIHVELLLVWREIINRGEYSLLDGLQDY